ncbi:MAG TPA: nucleotidyl transferase AbiEii/AbiGii toxin family protein [Candidatus Sulfotelmatobacter sp.]|nr:nucleotidyl transferase AbiEii/AbiGii toxin family protein [Candidatus Sulfotelmatobacter sp.]
MRLFEHPDFEQAILRAAEHFRERNLRPAIIEKDYYVTEALRVIANTSGDKIIFKGGTSLSKGWNLIQRFSEDIDIFLDPTAFQPVLGKNAIDRELKKLRDAVGQHPALSFVEAESKTIGGFGRNDRFSYNQRLGGPGEVANRVLLEAGTASGREPSAMIELHSYLGQYLEEKKQSLGAEDEGRFSLRLLHFRRTFVEKMFAIHSKVEILKRDKQPLGSYARHYYDIFQLSGHPEVEAMLRSPEYAAIKADYDQISRTHFSKSYFFPEEMSFARSDALFPPPELMTVIGAEYEAQCRMLCYGPYPAWADVQARLLNMRDLL